MVSVVYVIVYIEGARNAPRALNIHFSQKSFKIVKQVMQCILNVIGVEAPDF